MATKIIWSHRAVIELSELLQYWAERNGSNIFSAKLYTEIQKELKLLSVFPKLGRRTNDPDVRIKIIQNYLLYYEVVEGAIHVLRIHHGSRNSDV